VVYCRFEPWSGQAKDYEIGICCFSAKHVALRSKSKDRLAQNYFVQVIIQKKKILTDISWSVWLLLGFH
jgi:hypothetical protein